MIFMDDTNETRVKTKYRSIDTQAVIAMLPSIPKDVVVKAAFYDLDPELWELLISEKWLSSFLDHARLLLTDLKNQLVEYRAALRCASAEEDLDWERRTLKVKSRVSTLTTWLELRYKQIQPHSLRKAIEMHRAVVMAEYEPTAPDLALWEVLDR